MRSIAEPARVDRDIAAREDPAALARWWADPATRVLRVGTRSTVAATTGDRAALDLEPPAGAYDDQRHLLLGVVAGVPHFMVMDEAELTSLRDIAAVLAPESYELATIAAALANWHALETHCPRCGAPTDIIRGGFARRCQACDRELFPRHDPAMIVAVLDDEDRLLLGHQRSWPAGRYSTLAGFCEAGESLEQCVHREVAEEVGVELAAVRYVASQAWPFPRSLMCAFVARAATTRITVDGVEITHADWFTRDEVLGKIERGEMSLPAVSVSASALLIGGWLDGDLAAPAAPL